MLWLYSRLGKQLWWRSSVTFLKNKKCTAIYFGTENCFDDEKGHVLIPNQPLAVCDKTAGAFKDLKNDIFISESTYFYDGGGCC